MTALNFMRDSSNKGWLRDRRRAVNGYRWPQTYALGLIFLGALATLIVR